MAVKKYGEHDCLITVGPIYTSYVRYAKQKFLWEWGNGSGFLNKGSQCNLFIELDFSYFS